MEVEHDSCSAIIHLRDYLKTPEGIKESLKKVRDIGYTSVQVSGIGPIGSMS